MYTHTHTHFFFLFPYLTLVLNILNEYPITVLCPLIVLLYTYYSNHCFLEHTVKSSSITFEERKLRDCMKVKSCRTDKILRFGKRTSLQRYLIFYSLKLNKASFFEKYYLECQANVYRCSKTKVNFCIFQVYKKL